MQVHASMAPAPQVRVLQVGLVEDVFLPLAMFLGLAYLISLMIFDAYVGIAGKPARIWIPGKSLVLSALMIQILSYLKVKPVKWSQDLPLEIRSKEIVQNVFVGELGRVVMCVLIGYLLPGMGRAGSATDWSTLAALVISLFTSEFLYLKNLFSIPMKGYSVITSGGLDVFYVTLLAINMVVMVSIIMLILFSISAILAGRRIRSMLAEKISVIQWDKRKDSEVASWEKFEAEIEESWFLSHVCHPQYVIARSVLSSAAGLVVNICIILMAIRQFSLLDHNLSLLCTEHAILFLGWILEWMFILIGGSIIFCRWFTAVAYFPRSFVIDVKLRGRTRSFVEDYWTKGIFELIDMYKLQNWRLKELSKVGIPASGRELRLATKMKLHYLLYVLVYLQVSLIFFSKVCFFISQLVFNYKFVRIFLPRIGQASSTSQEFQHYRELLEKACMPRENPEHLWAANEKSMNQVKRHFEESTEKGREYARDLINFINETRFRVESNDDRRFVCQLESLPFVREHFPALNESCITMTALSLSFVIIKISPVYKDRLQKVCRQALDLMSFVDNSDPRCPTTIDMLKVIDIEADRVGLAIYNEFQSLERLPEENSDSLKKSPNLTSPWAAQEATIKEILEEAKKQLDEFEKQLNKKKSEIREQSGGGEEDVEGKIQQVERSEHVVKEEYSMDWSAIAGHYSKYRVCNLILSRGFKNVNELLEDLADVIMYCLFKLPKVMVKTCREWAVTFEEEKIWDTMYIAGKVVGVVKECHVEVEGNILEPKFLTTTSNETERCLQPQILEDLEGGNRDRTK